MPMDPATAGPRSDRMSPNRLEPTTTSNQSGCCTKCAHRMSMWNWSVLDVGVALRHRGEALVPVRHGEGDAVRLGGRGHVLLRPRHRQLEGVFQDPVGADAGEDRSAGRRTRGRCPRTCGRRPRSIRPRCSRAPRRSRCPPRCGRPAACATPGISLQGRRFDVLVEAAADRDQQAPERDMVRHAGPAHRAEQDRCPTVASWSSPSAGIIAPVCL